MRKLLCLFLVMLYQYVGFAQIISPQQIRETILKAKDLSYQNRDSALYLANIALYAAEKLDSTCLVFHAHRALGLINEDNNRLQEAQKEYALALNLADKYLKTDEQLTIYTDWAIIHKKLGQYSIALDYHLLTIERAEKEGNWEMAENGYHGLGTLYSMLSDFNQSIHYYLLSIKAAEKWDNKKGIVLTQQNISNIHLKAMNLDLASINIAKTYQMALELGDSTRIAAVLGIYGNIETAIGNLDNALAKHLQATTIFEKKGNKARLLNCYLSMGHVYYLQKKFKEAEKYFIDCVALKDFSTNYLDADLHNKLGKLYNSQNKTNKAIEELKISLFITNKFGFKEIAKDNHKLLADIYNKNKDFANAYQESLAVNDISNILFQEANQKNMTEAQFKFDFEKRDLQINAQNKQLKQSNTIRLLLIIGLLLSVVLLYITWVQMRKNQKSNKQIKLIIKELHHRVKNNLQTISSMMRLQARQSQDPSVSSVLLENKLRLETFSMLHQQLYQTDDIQKADLQPFIHNIIDKLQFAYSIPNEKIITHISIENKLLDVEKTLPLGLIINELLTNSFKYAYPSVSILSITILIKNNQLHYADNGNNLPTHFDFDKKKGFGMNLITAFSQQIKGKYRFYNNKGFNFDMNYMD